MRDKVMNMMNSEIKKVVARVKDAQTRLQDTLKKADWMEEARTYAEKQGKEVKKLFTADAAKVKTFIEKQRKELEGLQKKLPGEVKKFRDFAQTQRKELEKLLTRVQKARKKATRAKKTSSASK